jgi:cell division protein FtsI (penicillin-binding protein 3)
MPASSSRWADVQLSPGLPVGRFTITDTHPFNGACSVAEIMKESSNIGTAQIAAQVGASRQRAFLDKMGFLSPVAKSS